MGIGTYMLLVNLCDLGVIIFLDFFFVQNGCDVNVTY